MEQGYRNVHILRVTPTMVTRNPLVKRLQQVAQSEQPVTWWDDRIYIKLLDNAGSPELMQAELLWETEREIETSEISAGGEVLESVQKVRTVQGLAILTIPEKPFAFVLSRSTVPGKLNSLIAGLLNVSFDRVRLSNSFFRRAQDEGVISSILSATFRTAYQEYTVSSRLNGEPEEPLKLQNFMDKATLYEATVGLHRAGAEELRARFSSQGRLFLYVPQTTDALAPLLSHLACLLEGEGETDGE